MRPSHLAAAAVLALHAACTPSIGRGGVPPVQSSCRLSHGTLVMSEADLGMAPGESRLLDPPVAHHGPSGPHPIPQGCPVTWTLEGTGADLDGAGRLTVAPGARVGDSLSVVARAMESSARARVLVVAPGPNPLAGTWQQVWTPGCVGFGGPIGELVLRRSGGMMLTVRPFETYVDVAGSYTYDAARGLLRLRSRTRVVDDGLFLAARARVEGDSLQVTLEPDGDRVGLFGSQPGEGGCTAVFRRVGAAR